MRNDHEKMGTGDYAPGNVHQEIMREDVHAPATYQQKDAIGPAVQSPTNGQGFSITDDPGNNEIVPRMIVVGTSGTDAKAAVGPQTPMTKPCEEVGRLKVIVTTAHVDTERAPVVVCV